MPYLIVFDKVRVDNRIFSIIVDIMTQDIENLVTISNIFLKKRNISRSTLGQLSVCSSTVFSRIDAERVTIRTLNRMMVYLSRHWPEGVTWPPEIARPRVDSDEGSHFVEAGTSREKIVVAHLSSGGGVEYVARDSGKRMSGDFQRAYAYETIPRATIACDHLRATTDVRWHVIQAASSVTALQALRALQTSELDAPS